MRRDQLPLVTLDGRHAGELLAHPCACGRQRCTLGLHILLATRDMTPGPRAQSFEPSAGGGFTIVDQDHVAVIDPTLTIDQRFTGLVQAYWNAARDLTREMERLRPDRWIPLPEPASDNDWCRNHLETIGACWPRYRGDLCRSCYDLHAAHGHLPDGELMRLREARGYYRDIDIKEWLARLPKTTKRKRKKAS